MLAPRPLKDEMPPTEFVQAVIDQRAALFIGADMFQGADFPGWAKLSTF